VGTQMVRIGLEQEGGYLVLDYGLEELDAFYSVGVNYDTVFEISMMEKYPNI
jgi:hypothetical protein